MTADEENLSFDSMANIGSSFVGGMLHEEQKTLSSRRTSLHDKARLSFTRPFSSMSRGKEFPSHQDADSCRICYDSIDELTKNPLVSPCNCTGSMKLIHLNCLREWINSYKTVQETPNSRSYFWEQLKCELCK